MGQSMYLHTPSAPCSLLEGWIWDRKCFLSLKFAFFCHPSGSCSAVAWSDVLDDVVVFFPFARCRRRPHLGGFEEEVVVSAHAALERQLGFLYFFSFVASGAIPRLLPVYSCFLLLVMLVLSFYRLRRASFFFCFVLLSFISASPLLGSFPTWAGWLWSSSRVCVRVWQALVGTVMRCRHFL